MAENILPIQVKEKRSEKKKSIDRDLRRKKV
jgi:hypothetical protein